MTKEKHTDKKLSLYFLSPSLLKISSSPSESSSNVDGGGVHNSSNTTAAAPSGEKNRKVGAPALWYRRVSNADQGNHRRGARRGRNRRRFETCGETRNAGNGQVIVCDESYVTGGERGHRKARSCSSARRRTKRRSVRHVTDMLRSFEGELRSL